MKLKELREAATRLQVEINRKSPQIAQSTLQKIQSQIKFNK